MSSLTGRTATFPGIDRDAGGAVAPGPVAELVAEIEDELRAGDPDRRAGTLRRVTDLFLREAPALTDAQIDLFDVVIARLATAIEAAARVELSERLADVANAPRGIVRSLAHDEIAVARPVLQRSERLSDDDLVAVALAKGRDHMLAISERGVLTEPVTDVLVSRGDRAVAHALAGNSGARLSEGGTAALVERARADEALHALLRARDDLPQPHLAELIAIAAEAARRRLADSLPGLAGAEGAFDGALRRSVSQLKAAVVSGGRDYTAALGTIQALARARALTEGDLAAFAAEGGFETTVCALAQLAGLSIESAEELFTGKESDLILLVGKAQGWAWATVRLLLRVREPGLPVHKAKRAADTYGGLSEKTADRVVAFIRSREAQRREAARAAAARHQARAPRGLVASA